jgi:hypothetical protein
VACPDEAGIGLVPARDANRRLAVAFDELAMAT